MTSKEKDDSVYETSPLNRSEKFDMATVALLSSVISVILDITLFFQLEINALPFAIFAIVLGVNSRKVTQNKKQAIIAIWLGSSWFLTKIILIAVFIFALLLVNVP